MAYKGPQVVVGPSSSTDNTIPRFDLTTGALIQGSSVTISDADAVSGVTQLDVDNIRLDGNTISSTDTNGNVILAPDGSGTVSVTTAPIVPSGDRADSLGSATNSWDNVYADGLTFDDGTNVLSTYVEATSWTPVLEFGGASVGITYATQLGTYSRIGNTVFYRLHIYLSNKGSSTGDATISGLPLSPGGSGVYGFSIGHFSKITTNTAEYTSLGGYIASIGPALVLFQNARDGNAVQPLQNGDFANDSLVIFSGHYFT